MPTELPEGTVTIVFTDVVGSTALTNRLGGERGRTLMREVDELVRAQVTVPSGSSVGIARGLLHSGELRSGPLTVLRLLFGPGCTIPRTPSGSLEVRKTTASRGASTTNAPLGFSALLRHVP